MDLSNLIAIYGKPSVKPCPACNGKGCLQCKNFGYIGETNDEKAIYTFDYPMYIELKQRQVQDFTRWIILAILTMSAIFAIVISYIINFTRNG